MSSDRYTEHDPDLHPDWWKKCGNCPTLLPIDPSFLEWGADRYHRHNEAGAELCWECTEAAQEAEELAEALATARQTALAR